MFFFSNAFLSFKRAMGVFMVWVLSLGYSLGFSTDFQGVYYDRSSVVAYSFYDSTRKVGINEYLEKTADYDIYLARNETEACQIVLRSKFNSTSRKYSVEFTDFTNENGDVLESTVYEEQYITCVSNKNYGTYPDALVPFLSGKQYTLSSQINWPFYIQARADETTPAGKYAAQVVVKSLHDDKVQLVADVTATVWDFALPETPAMDTAFGLGRGNIVKAHHAADDPERAQALYEQYYEFMLDHKISPYTLPVDILSDEADAYMSDPRVKSFIIPYPGDDVLLQEYYQKVQSNPEWAKKGYFYPIDEPWNLTDYARYTAITDRLDRLCPGYNMVTPFTGVSFKENGTTYYGAYLQAKSNIVCPISSNFSNKDFLMQMDERRADGSKIWWYICCAPNPKTKYANIFTQSEGIEGRLLMWQQKKLNVTGLLYWDTTYWNDVTSPWASAWTTPWTGNDTFGDGSLLYPGQDGPVASLRLEYVSDGIEDFEYLTIAERLFGSEYVAKKIAEVTNTLEDYTRNDSVLANVRVAVGNDIAAALSE
ncbi:MAG: DUF4091 domain-containing protein [Oscillospiraceae bacterium]|jgi:hypothetical protein|nr:DUF4091 domain-containing protein [Oscillospiraceae bacterium]